MNPQTNQDQGISLPGLPGEAATMPLPQGQGSPLQPAPPQPSGATEQTVPVPPAEPPIAAQLPILPLTVPVRPVAEPERDDTKPADPAPEQPAAMINTPADAADGDVIEKEWVVKAKQIVAATRQDPYKQVQEINRLKADYMKKRYNKDIKLPDA